MGPGKHRFRLYVAPQWMRSLRVAGCMALLLATCTTPGGWAGSMSHDKAATWFAFQPGPDSFLPSVIDTSEWLDAPAGKHGWLDAKDGDLYFEDGTPIVFWGTNVCDSAVHDSLLASAHARRLAKYGMNAVRFHKFTYPGSGVVVSDGPSTVLDERRMAGMDRFFYELRQRGIYVTWSHIFGHRVSSHDNLESGFVGDAYGLANFAPDLQDLMIRLTVNLLEHVNPYTGLRYADDPALAVIELQNEDNVFWSVQEKADANPYYRRLLDQLFGDWLEEKYETEEALRAAWGARALEAGESLAERSIYTYAHHWYLGSQAMAQFPEKERRLLDNARFLYETQLDFYNRYVAAIRATGYQGLIIGSPWQAGEGVAHWYNLHCDYLTGIVDRHAYWGGGIGRSAPHSLVPGTFQSESMLASPGAGLLGVGLQQVLDHPFIISEWASTPPNEWLSEAPLLIAAYGLGLQGWDGSFSFASDIPSWSGTLQKTHGNIYNISTPTHLAQYPALSRMIYRGDVKEGELVSLTDVDVDSLQEQQTLPPKVDPMLLALGKMAVQFSDVATAEESLPSVRLGSLWDKEQKVITSTTGELQWHYGEKAHVTLDTPGTQGIVGFMRPGEIRCRDIIISDVDTPFVNLLVTSLSPEPMAQSKTLLVTALARSRNSGMKYDASGRALEQAGYAPLLMEPVQATITLLRPGVPTVHELDAHGRRTGQEVPVKPHDEGASFRIDGNYETFWYEVSYGD